MKILLDTTVIVDALRVRRNRHELLAQLIRQGHRLHTTALNAAEVYAGMRPNEEKGTEAFLDGLQCFVADREAARMGGRLKKQWADQGRTLTLIDCIVAAVAIQNECALATDNRKDFPMPEVQLYPMP